MKKIFFVLLLLEYAFPSCDLLSSSINFSELFPSDRVQIIEIINQEDAPSDVDIQAQRKVLLMAGEKKTINAEPGFAFCGSKSTTLKVMNPAKTQSDAYFAQQQIIAVQPGSRLRLELPSSSFFSCLSAVNKYISWDAAASDKISVTFYNNELQHEKACNEKYQQLERGLAITCSDSRFAQFTMQDSQRRALQKNLPQNISLLSLSTVSAFEPCEKSVLISMVKDEADIIFENLCWHFFMGFRKFIVIDNGSTDGTSSEIRRFKDLTALSARVIKIDEPSLFYTQASRMNAISKLAESIFPEVEWIFPNDADEFIVFDGPMRETMHKISSNINCVHSPRITYIPSDDYFSMPNEQAFYKKLHVAHKRNPYGYSDDNPWNGKTFIRAHQGILINKGNHFASDLSSTVPTYISGLDVGIHIREYPLRSPEHALRKITNMGKAHAALRKVYPTLDDRHYAHERYDRYLEIGDLVGREEFDKFMKTGGCEFDEGMPLERSIEHVARMKGNQAFPKDFYFLPSVDIAFIFSQKLFAEEEVAKRLIVVGNKLGLQSRTEHDFTNQNSKYHLDVCMTGAPWDNPFTSNPSKYSYLYSHVNTAAMCQHFNPSEKKYKFFLQVGKNCSVPNASLYGRKKEFYFSMGLTNFEDPNITGSSIFFCGGSWDARYGRALSIMDEKPFFNWYGSDALSSRKSYRGFAKSAIEAIKKHHIALTLHSKHHLDNSEPSARIFEAAAAGAVIISDRHPFVLENFADSVLYIDQEDSEDKIAADIITHYQWIKNNPEQAITMARRAHQIFVRRFTAEEQLLKIVQMHQEAVILDGDQPLLPRSDFSYVYDKLNLKNVNQLLKTTHFQQFKIQNLTDQPIDDLIRCSFIKRVNSAGETINAPSGTFFVDDAGQRSTALTIQPCHAQEIAHANLAMGHEGAIDAGSTKICNLLGQNIYLTSLVEKSCVLSYGISWNVEKGLSIILR